MNLKTVQKLITFVWLLTVTLASLFLLFSIWNGNFFKTVYVNDELSFRTYAYTFIAGVLGSLIFAFRGFYKSTVEASNSGKAFNFSWIYWYITRPLAGGIFGFVIYAFSRAELIAFGLTTRISEQNNLMFFSLSFLAGFGFHEFAEYITKKVKNMFRNV